MNSLKIFISYSHKDAKDKNKLETHLGVLESAAPIETWTDTRIGAGQDWRGEIDKALNEAAVAVLLITANFLTSKFIKAKEVPEILERWKDEGLTVFPIVGRQCPWKEVPWLVAMQVRPKDAKPIGRSGGRYADEELTQITYEVADAVKAANLKRQLEEEGASNDRRARVEEALAAERRRVEQEVQQNRGNLFRQAVGLRAKKVGGADLLERQKAQMERWRILHDTQAKIFEIQQSVMEKRAQTIESAAQQWDQLINPTTP